MGSKITLFLLFLLPVVVFPIGASFFETPKVILAQIGILVLIFTAKNLQNINQLFAALVTLLILVILLNPSLYQNLQTLFGNSIRLQGAFTFILLLIFAVISSKDSLKIPQILPVFTLVALGLSALILGGNEEGRVFGTLGAPNVLAATAVFILPFTLKHQNFKLKLTYIAIVLLIIVLSASRSGLFALIIISAFLMMVYKLKTGTKLAAILAIILIIATQTLPFLEKPKLFESRKEIWQTAVVAGFDSPIIGAGFGNTQQALVKASENLNNNIRFQSIDSSHNILLDFWVQGGSLGLVLLITIISISIVRLIKKQENTILSSYLAILTALMFNPLSIVNLIGFFWVVGQGFKKWYN